MTREEIANINPQAVLWDGLDEAIIGMAKRQNGVLSFYDSNGEITPELDENYYEPDNYDEGDDPYDKWGREEFEGVVAYNVFKILEIFAKDMEVTPEDLAECEFCIEEDIKMYMAMEHFSYNTDGAFVGEFTPIHIFLEQKEEKEI
jgi:hypothetical protein